VALDRNSERDILCTRANRNRRRAMSWRLRSSPRGVRDGMIYDANDAMMLLVGSGTDSTCAVQWWVGWLSEGARLSAHPGKRLLQLSEEGHGCSNQKVGKRWEAPLWQQRECLASSLWIMLQRTLMKCLPEPRAVQPRHRRGRSGERSACVHGFSTLSQTKQREKGSRNNVTQHGSTTQGEGGGYRGRKSGKSEQSHLTGKCARA
jgi:hypothetical protein